MTAREVSGGGKVERAGSRTLGLLSSDVNVKIMRTMAGGFEALTVRRHDRPAEVPPELEVDPGEPKYGITAAGMETLPAAGAVEYWLLKAPEGPLAYEDPEAEEAIEALAEGWATAVIHALAHAPMTPAGLEQAVDGIGRGQIADLLGRMRRAGQLEARGGEGEDATYAITDWLRRGIAPIAVCARVERRLFAAETVPLDALDIESALLLSLPLVRLPADLSGACRLSVQMSRGPNPPLVGATVAVEEGRIAFCAPGLDADAPAEASGNIRNWFRAIIDGGVNRLDFSGDRPLAHAIVKGLHEVLFVAG